MKIAGRLIVSALAAVASVSPAAADPAPGPGWVVDWGAYRCALIRQSGPATFALRTVPGTGVWEVRLVSRRWSVGDPHRLAISLQPADDALPDRRYVERTAAGETLIIYQLQRNILDRVAASRGIRAARNGETVLDIAYADAGQAIAAVRQCEDQILREWGIDPVAFAALRAPPAGNAAAVVSDGDYPPAALRAGQSGTVVVRLAVDAEGRVTACAPVVRSGHSILDVRTCQIYQQRLRLTPAIGADGAPTAAPMVAMLNWQLSR